MSILGSLVLIVVLAYAILGCALFLLQSTFLYYPIRDITCTPNDIGLRFEKVILKTEDGLKIAAWFIPADNAACTVLLCHGNAGNLSHRMDTINILNEMGLNCLAFDYRGFGESQGKPTEEGTYLDAEAAWKWLNDKKNIPPEQIIVFGRSLGGTVAANLSAKFQPRGLVVESCFTSYVDMGKKYYPYMPIKLFASFQYDTVEYIRKVHCPVLIIHSKDDEIIPFEFAQRLYEAANEPKEFVEIFGSHNEGFILSGQTYTQAWAEWMVFLAGFKANSQ
jgi:fermentation-respiration switch protein FrsA (DUF1100 family)